MAPAVRLCIPSNRSAGFNTQHALKQRARSHMPLRGRGSGLSARPRASGTVSNEALAPLPHCHCRISLNSQAGVSIGKVEVPAQCPGSNPRQIPKTSPGSPSALTTLTAWCFRRGNRAGSPGQTRPRWPCLRRVCMGGVACARRACMRKRAAVDRPGFLSGRSYMLCACPTSYLEGSPCCLPVLLATSPACRLSAGHDTATTHTHTRARARAHTHTHTQTGS